MYEKDNSLALCPTCSEAPVFSLQTKGAEVDICVRCISCGRHSTMYRYKLCDVDTLSTVKNRARYEWNSKIRRLN